jgi:hypothetical protein
MSTEAELKRELYAFELHYLTGEIDYGMIVAPDRQVAIKRLEDLSLIGLKAVVVQTQPEVIYTLLTKFAGMAVFTNNCLYS